MAIATLRDDLLNLPGVESAELDGDPGTPAGIRVGLSRGSDPATVGAAVHRVLAQHGLRPDDLSSMAPASPVAAPDSDGAVAEPVPRPEPYEAPFGSASADGARPPAAGLESVSVGEGRNGIVVSAIGDGASVSVRAAGSSTPAVDQAVVAAVCALAATETVPLVCGVDEGDLGGTPVVTVVIEEGGARLVGSAVVEAGRSYALGRAVWAALSSR